MLALRHAGNVHVSSRLHTCGISGKSCKNTKNAKNGKDITRVYFKSVEKLISDLEMQPFELLFGVTIVLFSVFHRKFRVEFWGRP